MGGVDDSEVDRMNQVMANTDLSLNNEDRESNDEFYDWIQKNHWFFTSKFFPAAQKHETLTQLINRSI